MEAEHSKKETVIEAKDSEALEKKLNSRKKQVEGVTVQTPSGRRQIEPCSFQWNSDIKKVIIEGQTEIVGDLAFYKCENLGEVFFPEKLKGIGNYAFAECGLQHLNLPDSLERIGDGAFSSNCLDEVIIPEGVSMILKSAFSDCPCLRHVKIPSSIKYIGIRAFDGCPLLTEVEIGGDRKPLESREFIIIHDEAEMSFLGLFRDVKMVIVSKGFTGLWYNNRYYSGQSLLGDDIICEFSEFFRDSRIDQFRERILDGFSEDDYNYAEGIFTDDGESLLKLYIAGCARMLEKKAVFTDKIAQLLIRCPELGNYRDLLGKLSSTQAIKSALDMLDSSTQEQKATLEGIIDLQRELEDLKGRMVRAKAEKKKLLEKFNASALERIDVFIKEKLKDNRGLIRLYNYPRFEMPTETVASRLSESTSYEYTIQKEEPYILFKQAISIREGEYSHLPIVTWNTGHFNNVGRSGSVVYEEYFSELPMDVKLEFYRLLSGPKAEHWGAYVERCPLFLGDYLPDYDDVVRFEERLPSHGKPSESPTYPEPLALVQKKIQHLRYRRNENPDLENGRKIVEIQEGVLTIPNGVKAIGISNDEVPITNFVKWPEKITSVILPDSLEIIGNMAFSGCASLKSLVIPKSVVQIGDKAFSGCASLESVIIPEGVSQIGRSAFEGCKMLKSLSIPASVTKIKEPDRYETTLFGPSCGSLESITVAKGNPVYDSRDDCNALIKSDDGSLLLGCVNTVIPEGVTSIANYAFHRCDIESITFPNSVKKIDACAFENCQSLKEVTFNDGLEEIGFEAFSQCYSLKDIILPSSMKKPLPYACYVKETPTRDRTWYGAAFKDCLNIKSISIPRKLSFTRTGTSANDPIERCSTKTLIKQIGLLEHIILPEYGRQFLGWDLKEPIWFQPEIDVIIRKVEIPKSKSILVDLGYDDYHMICKVSLHLLETKSYYEIKDGRFGACRLEDPYQDHLAGIYLVDSPVIKKWGLCKDLNFGIRFGPKEYEEKMMPILCAGRRLDLADFWP